MARKSNKTAHVLNLLAGHDTPQEGVEETENTAKAPAPTPENETDPPADPTVPSKNIAVIDTTETDPVAELIQSRLTDEFEKGSEESGTPTTEEMPAPAVMEQEPPAPVVEEEPPAPVVEEESPVPIVEEEPSAPVVEEESPVPVVEEAPPAPVVEETPPAPVADEEPAFTVVNVMERIVKDKIIYFMRQFDVCTCDRCIADTVALTLNGLMPKYIVTAPEAVDPLLSFYTNKFISDVTVEATKACIVIKDNPRH